MEKMKIKVREKGVENLIEVEGHVLGLFGIHKSCSKGSGKYTVSHLPTGYKALTARTIKQAKVAIEKMQLLGDWNFTTPAMYPEFKTDEMRGKIYKIREEALLGY